LTSHRALASECRRLKARPYLLLGLAAAAFAAMPATAWASFEVKPRGRLHLDSSYAFGEDDAAWSNGLRTRRVRMGLDGRLDDHWDFRIEFDFAEEGVGAREVRLRRSLGPGRLMIGQVKAPMGLNELTGSNDLTFIERSTPTAIVADGFRLGVGYDAWFGEDLVGVQTRVYGRAIGEATAGDMQHAIGGRGVVAPVIGQGRLHLGLSGAFEHRGDNTAIRYSDRPEARGADGGTRLIDTGVLDAALTGKVGAELAFITGPFSVEAEYLAVYVHRDDAESVYLDGFHAQTSYILTGESRGYRQGGFGAPSPSRSYGAWEAALRYSRMSLDDADLQGGTQTNLTVGLNWYATDRVRFMLNHVLSMVEGGVFGDETLHIVQARAQYAF
jgi:phosphate-selective porin OprO and OprP